MTTIALIVALLLAGPIMFASPRPWVYVPGALCFAVGLFLWWGVDLLCGSGPLMHCAIVQ